MADRTPDALNFLAEYINNAAPTGHEYPGQKLWLDYIRPFVDEIGSDPYGTAYGVINPGKKYKVVIEAHADEISWMVNYISDDGFLNVVKNGGSDHIIAPSMRVNIHGKKGIIKGVFGWPAIHVRRGKDANLAPTPENIFVDCGAKNKDEVLALGIQVGTQITFEDAFTRINDRFYAGRALDNRMGGFCIAEVARTIKEKKIKLPYSLYVVNAVQEEVGLRGAEMIVRRLQPDCAIIVDVTHDTSTPLLTKSILGDVKCGDGPSITYGPSVHNKFIALLESAAEEQKISLQREAASRSTGTDTDAFAYSSTGVPSVLVSIPLRYMHTTVEMAHQDDVDQVIELITATLQKITDGHSFSYFN